MPCRRVLQRLEAEQYEIIEDCCIDDAPVVENAEWVSKTVSSQDDDDALLLFPHLVDAKATTCSLLQQWDASDISMDMQNKKNDREIDLIMVD